MESGKRILLALFLLIAAALVLFTCNLGALSFWGDEVGSILYARNGFIPMIKVLLKEDVHPPLYYLILHWWIELSGEGEFALRFLSVFFAILSLFAVYKLAEELFDEKVALLTVLLMVFSPEFLLFGRMVRYYSLALMFAALSTWLFIKIIKGGGFRYLAFYVVTSALLLYTTYTTLSVLIAHNLIILFGLKEYGKQIKRWVFGQAAIFLLYLPCVIMFLLTLARMSREGLPPSDISAGLAGVALKLVYSLYSFGFGETLFPWRLIFVVPGAAAYLFLFYLALRSREKKVFFLAALLFVPLFFTIAIMSTVKTSSSFMYTPARTLFALPFFYMAAAFGISRLKTAWVKYVLILILLSVSAVSQYNYFAKKDFLMPVYLMPWREALKEVESAAGPGDLLVAEETREIDYYFSKGGYHFRFIIAEDEAKNYLDSNPAARLFYLKTGRDHQPSGLSEDFVKWVSENYMLNIEKGFVNINDTYNRIKKSLLKREPYEYKMELRNYEKI